MLGKPDICGLMMTAITAATVDTVLEYVDRGIPAYLLSKPLLQRHHFLGISPDNAEEYLAWPSPDRSHAVRLLLESHPIPPSHDTPLCVNYTADPENILAHVRITPELRLVFLWDSNQWLYHNLALMPFPPNSYSTFNDALVAYSSDDFLQEQSYSLTVDDDSYWNSYGNDSDQPSISADALDETSGSEDAYWAQYSTVQGSGDSTLPSPLPTKQKFPRDDPERVIVPSEDLQIYHADPYNPLEPPSPEALSRRLAALSAAESGAASPPLFDDSPTTDSNTASPQLTEVAPTEDSSFPSPGVSQEPVNEFLVVDPGDSVSLDNAEELLRDNIKALFRLWKSGRGETSTDRDKDIFLASVRQALEQV